jgi:predicted P-loop ATPase
MMAGDWLNQGIPLTMNAKNQVLSTLSNGIMILTQCPKAGGCFYLNEFTAEIEIQSPFWHRGIERRPITDDDLINARVHLEQRGINLPKQSVADVVRKCATMAPYHPIKDFLSGSNWDGIERIHRLFPEYFGSDDNAYTTGISSKWLISAVARIFRPGCKVDTMVVLEGSQGRGKSTAIQALFGAKHTGEVASNIWSTPKRVLELTAGKWAIELAEMESVANAKSRSQMKAAITTASDRDRLAYGSTMTERPRQFIFVGTCNPEPGAEWHHDHTGGRRFWPVRVGAIDIDAIYKDRTQLWAEAVHYFRHGTNWWIDDDVLKAAQEAEMSDRLATEPYAEMIERNSEIAALRTITATEACRLLGLTPEQQAKQCRSVGRGLKELGWVQTRTMTGRVWHNPAFKD